MTPGVGQSDISPEQADALRARGLPAAVHLGPETQPDDDGRRADRTDWRTAYQAQALTLLECRRERRMKEEEIEQLRMEAAKLRTALSYFYAESIGREVPAWMLPEKCKHGQKDGFCVECAFPVCEHGEPTPENPAYARRCRKCGANERADHLYDLANGS